MRSVTTAFMVGLAACSNAETVTESESYSLLLREDGQTWCAYKNPADFLADAANLKPTESARVTYSADRLAELTYQTEAESGDWIVLDKYTPMDDGGVALRRTNLMTQENLQVVQETVLYGDKAEPLHVSVSTLDGKKAESPNVDLPEVSVRTSLAASPFVQLSAELRSQSLGKLCKEVD